MAIYAFGDSHAHYLFALCPDITTFWLGPRTMHRVARDGAPFVPHLASPKPEDTIVLVFGEIDVRCHIARIADLRGQSLEWTIGDLISRYVAQVRLTLDHFGIRSRVAMVGVPPPMDPVMPNPRLPTYGPLDRRIDIRRMLNTVLEEHASAFGITFVPIPKLYENPDGSMRMHLSDGHAHITIDHAHGACRELGARISRPLRFKRPSGLHRLCLATLRSRAFKRRDDVALWDLGRLEYGLRRRGGDDEVRSAPPLLPHISMP